ncbi:MAG: AAA family ATPase [Intrasporangium sp.]|uniref:helix-turn-helix transcriptional regulator n=1 Tax=Intrasporangium sp. TaxID=1925024 RepID=UPI0026484E22|nr:LuxR family transcriptional regulator [Intrasporangium sp.]MDN5798271.1 AAA family ATPase [Intrasporangium sp.]
MAGAGGVEGLVGRERELGIVLDAAERARCGSPAVVVIEGEPGLGKTRLLQEVADRLGVGGPDADSEAPGAPPVVAVGHGTDLAGGSIPYGVAAGVLDRLIAHVGVDRLRGLDRRTITALALIHPALAEVPDGTALDRLALLAGFQSLICEIGSVGLVCLVVEDLHWADEPSLDLLTLLATSPPTDRFLFLATTRPPVDRAGRGAQHIAGLTGLVPGHGRGDLVTLRPLTDEQVAAYLRGVRDGSLSALTVSRITTLAQGVPLFLEALVADIDTPSGRLPSSIAASVAARQAVLTLPTRRVLEAAAVRGLPVDRLSLAAVTGLTEQDVREAVHHACEVRLLEPLGGGRYRLHHAIVCRAIEEALTDLSRETWHREWAAWLEDYAPVDASRTSSLAHHWYHAGDAQRAMVCSVAAARTATELEATQEAAAHWSRVMELWSSVEDPAAATGLDRDTLVMSLFWALRASGEVLPCHSLIAAELTTSPPPQGVRLLWLEVRRYLQPLPQGVGLPPRAVGSLTWEQVLSLTRDVLSHRDIRPSPMLLGLIGTLLNRALPADVSDRIQELMGGFDAAFDAESSVSVLALHAHGYLLLRQRRYDEALAREREAESAPEGTQPRERHRATANVVSSLVILGRVAAAVDHGERALARLGPVEAARGAWVALAQNLILARVHGGGWDRAHELFAVHERHADWWPIGESAGGIALIAAWQGRHAEARRVIALCVEDLPALEVASEPLTYKFQPYLAAACLAQSTGEVRRARQHLYPVLTSPGLADDAGVLWPVVLLAAQLAHLPGETTTEQQAWARLVSDGATQVDRVAELGEAWLGDVHAHLERAAGRDDADHWLDVATRWERLRMPLREASARLRRADVLLPHHGEGVRGEHRVTTRAARHELELAQALLLPLGAAPSLLHVQRLAGRGRLRLPSGAETADAPGLPSLTAREMEVAGLIAIGRTNQQIATSLFMSPKTASVHVSRIIMKLGVQNRTEVAAMLHREGLVDR